MNQYLENGSLQLKVDTRQARWSLTSRRPHGPAIDEAQMSAHYRTGLRQHRALTQWPKAGIVSSSHKDSPHGPLQTLRVETSMDENGLRYMLTFALPENEALLLWKIRVSNESEQPVQLDRIELLSAGFIYHARPGPHGRIRLAPLPEGNPGDEVARGLRFLLKRLAIVVEHPGICAQRAL
jgi:hypothetical protein